MWGIATGWAQALTGAQGHRTGTHKCSSQLPGPLSHQPCADALMPSSLPTGPLKQSIANGDSQGISPCMSGYVQFLEWREARGLPPLLPSKCARMHFWPCEMPCGHAPSSNGIESGHPASSLCMPMLEEDDNSSCWQWGGGICQCAKGWRWQWSLGGWGKGRES